MLKSFRMFRNQKAWDNAVEKTKQKLEKNTGHTNLAAFGSKIIAERIMQRPISYAEFGVYWFAVKDVLARHGYHFGADNDYEMLIEYRGISDEHTLVAAERFKDMYRQTYFQGNIVFTLDEDNMREWILSDNDMYALLKAV